MYIKRRCVQCGAPILRKTMRNGDKEPLKVFKNRLLCGRKCASLNMSPNNELNKNRKCHGCSKTIERRTIDGKKEIAEKFLLRKYHSSKCAIDNGEKEVNPTIEKDIIQMKKDGSDVPKIAKTLFVPVYLIKKIIAKSEDPKSNLTKKQIDVQNRVKEFEAIKMKVATNSSYVGNWTERGTIGEK